MSGTFCGLWVACGWFVHAVSLFFFSGVRRVFLRPTWAAHHPLPRTFVLRVQIQGAPTRTSACPLSLTTSYSGPGWAGPGCRRPDGCRLGRSEAVSRWSSAEGGRVERIVDGDAIARRGVGTRGSDQDVGGLSFEPVRGCVVGDTGSSAALHAACILPRPVVRSKVSTDVGPLSIASGPRVRKIKRLIPFIRS